MNLEGSLDAFGLPDVVSLLATTGKSGGLLLRRCDPDAAPTLGVVWVREGRISGATSDRSRSSLVRRVVGLGAVDDAALRQAVAGVVAGGGGVARGLLEAGAVEPELLQQAAAEQAVDAVFDLLRWTDGSFTFDPLESDPDEVGISLDPARVLAEASARAESSAHLAAVIPSADSVLAVPVVLHHDPEVTRDEWALLALVDGQRRVRDLVELTGAGEFAVTTTLAHLVQRGLLHVKDASSPDHVTVVERRMAMLASIEAERVEDPAPAPAPAAPEPVHEPSGFQLQPGPGAAGMTAAAALAAARAAQGRAPVTAHAARPAARQEVVPPRPEPFLPGRRPEHPEPAVASADFRPGATPSGAPVATAGGLSSHGGASVVDGSSARALADPVLDPVADGVIERDPGVNRSLLLRLIAGVRGL